MLCKKEDMWLQNITIHFLRNVPMTSKAKIPQPFFSKIKMAWCSWSEFRIFVSVSVDWTSI